ncbi:unnamed protein product [Ectocarpus sp. CCAP 1310/34]|nr:unnamed protein product [Ectocarpus sp. CCAP 1310/34]
MGDGGANAEVVSSPSTGLTTIMCWQNGTSFAIGEDVVHEFSIFKTHVYPRSM